MTSILQSIGAGIVSAALFIGGIFGYSPEPSYAPEPEALGADTVLPIAGQTYTLAGTGISSTATSFTLTSFTLTQTGYEIQDSDMSSTFYVTFEPGSRSRQELVSCTTVVQNSNDTATISGCTRGLLPITPYTASTTYQFAHAGGTSVVFSNPPQLYNEAAMKNNDETITGQWTFDIFPVTASTSIASTTASGIVELATGEEAASSTLSGDIATSKLALGTNISTSSAPTSGNVVVVTGDDGNIDSGFIGTLATTTVVGSFTLQEVTNIQRGIYVASTTGTSTFAVPTGVKKIKVQVVGGGGNGASGSDESYGGGGGGGGGYSMEYIDVSSTSSIVYYVGAATEETRFGNGSGIFLRATAGSTANGGVGGAGGMGSGGDINVGGDGGDSGGRVNGAARNSGGDGGSSVFGGGGQGNNLSNGAQTGAGGQNYGGGGAGGTDTGDGGVGAGGVIIIEW